MPTDLEPPTAVLRRRYEAVSKRHFYDALPAIILIIGSIPLGTLARYWENGWFALAGFVSLGLGLFLTIRKQLLLREKLLANVGNTLHNREQREKKEAP